MDAHRSMLSNGCVRRLLLDRATTEQGCILQIISIQITDSKMIISLTDGVDLIDALVSPHLRGNFVNNLCSSLSLIKLINYSIGRANDARTTLIINDFSIVANTQKLYLPMQLLKQQPEVAPPHITHHQSVAKSIGNASTGASVLYKPQYLPQSVQSHATHTELENVSESKHNYTPGNSMPSNSINQTNVSNLKTTVTVSGKENSNTSSNPRTTSTSSFKPPGGSDGGGGVKVPLLNRTSIIKLNPYTTGWSITCRIINKSSMKEYTSSYGNSGGKKSHYFSIDLRDQSGEISAVFFGEAADVWYSKLQHESVYVFSGGKLKIQDKYRSPRVNNELQVIFGVQCHIQAVADDLSIPVVTYTFISLKDALTISEKDLPTAADIIGVIQEHGEIAEIIKKETKKVLRKREIVLVDDSLVAMKLVLWDKQADEFPQHIRGHQDAVIVTIKNARIKMYNEEKYITTDGENNLKYNDTRNKSVQRLLNWLVHNYQHLSKVKLLENDIGYAFARRVTVQTLYKFMASNTNYTLNFIKKGQLLVLKCVITNVVKTSIHPYCACNTKLTEHNDPLSTCPNGQRYTCPNCNSVVTEPHSWKLMMRVHAIDSTGSIKMFLFDYNVCDKVLGISTGHSLHMSQQQLPQVQLAGDRIIFQPFLLTLKLVKSKFSNKKHSISCVECAKLDCFQENEALIEQLKKA